MGGLSRDGKPDDFFSSFRICLSILLKSFVHSCSRVFIWLLAFFCFGKPPEQINKREKLYSSVLRLTAGRSLQRGAWTSLILIDVHDFLFREKNHAMGGDKMESGKK